MFGRSTLLSGFLAISLLVCLAGRAMAELMTALFPDSVPGYDADDGIAVDTHLNPEQMPLGVREGAFRFLPSLDESFGYTSNAVPGPNRRGSWQIVTAPAVAVESGWERDAIGAVASAQDTRYVSLPSQDSTDATVSAGGRIDIGDDKLTLAAAHIAAHEDRGEIDTIASDRPIAFQLDDVRASYEISDGRWTITPSLQATNWTYADTTIMGSPASQAYRDRLVLQGGVTVHYELAPSRSVVFVVRTVGQDYTRTPAGQPSPNSTGYQVLGGIDYGDDPVWHWRVLVGDEVLQFASPLYARQNTLIGEAGVGWSPSRMTTVTAKLSRDTEDAEQEGVSGMVYSAARLTIDHEYLRNLLFKASIGLQRADFFQGGHQTGTTVGLGMTWVMNRNARLSVTYQQTDLHGSNIPAGSFVSGYSQGVGLLTMRLAI
jgi:hypothetical protein